MMCFDKRLNAVLCVILLLCSALLFAVACLYAFTQQALDDALTRSQDVLIVYQDVPVYVTEEVPILVYDETPVYCMTVKATAYCSCVDCCGIWSEEHPDRIGTGYEQLTASGTHPTAERTVAVDTDIFPYGTEIFYDGTWYVAEDTGGAVNGNHIDFYFDNHQDAVDFGVKEIEVLIKCVTSPEY